MTGDHQPQSLPSDSTSRPQQTPFTISNPYQHSLCGAILHCTPTKCPSAIFTYIRHNNVQALHRSLDVYHQDIIRIRNDDGQTVLHLLTIYMYPYKWVRLVMMRGCDLRAQDKDGYTAAHYAVERDDVEMLKALTMPFASQVKSFSEQYINSVHAQGIEALSLRNQHGLTVFMLACYHGSIKCVQYLLTLNINDVQLQDHVGDTCLYYAVARHNVKLVVFLLQKCQADVNGGDALRPSVLDVFRFSLECTQPRDRSDIDKIEESLQARSALHRYRLGRKSIKRKRSSSDAESSEPIAERARDDLSRESSNDRARHYAHLASKSNDQGDLLDARENYRQAMQCLPSDAENRAIYAHSLAMVHMELGEHASALDLLQEALTLRKRLEQDTEEVRQLEQSIDQIQQFLNSQVTQSSLVPAVQSTEKSVEE